MRKEENKRSRRGEHEDSVTQPEPATEKKVMKDPQTPKGLRIPRIPQD